MWFYSFLFVFGVVTLYWIEKDVKKICNDLDCLIDLLDPSFESTKEQESTKGSFDQPLSRKDLYK